MFDGFTALVVPGYAVAYPAGTGTLASQNGGTGWPSAWDSGANDINATGSTYTSGSTTLVTGSGRAVIKNNVTSFRDLPTTYSTGTYWLDFIAKGSSPGSNWGGL